MRRMRVSGVRGWLFVILAGVAPFAMAGQCVEPRDAVIPDIALEEMAGGFTRPVHVAAAGNGDGRLYVVEQSGLVWIIDSAGQRLPEPFLDITNRVSSGGERGLLSIAFDPAYHDNGHVFVNYTARKSGDLYTRVARFERDNDDMLDVHSEIVVLEVEQPYPRHNSGQVAFGPDEYLYIGMGDGGSANDPLGHGQRLSTLLGALLRIDVEPVSSGSVRYRVPAGNPYVGIPGAREEIWAHGLRNPWRFSFDQRTGLLYLGDVGQDHQEEINVITPGGNYGWPVMEGHRCNVVDAERCERRDLMAPILSYGREEGTAVTGGHVYRGHGIADLCGTYLYGDYGSGRIWGLRYSGGRVVAQRSLLETPHAISSFGQGENGEIYVVDHRAGSIMRVVAAGGS